MGILKLTIALLLAGLIWSIAAFAGPLLVLTGLHYLSEVWRRLRACVRALR